MFGRFWKDRRGSIPIITAAMLVPLLIVGGAGVDFMRHEVIRSKLQDSLDRGVLAAASLNQTQDTETTIRSYLKSANLPADILLAIDETKTLNYRRIAASASLTVPVAFLSLAGVGDIAARATSVAEEKRNNIELSLILDVSGSMVDKGVLETMKKAAQDFVGTVLRPDMMSVTSLNVVPFAGDVSVGPKIFDFLSRMEPPTILANQSGKPLAPKDSLYQRKHSKSSCFQFRSADYGKAFPFFPDIEQTAHFSYYNYDSGSNKGKWWCPDDSDKDTVVTVMNNDPTFLKTRLGKMRAYDGTGTHIAMKWAIMLLDPVMKPYVTYATTQSSDIKISPGFKDRPAAFDDPATNKFIVLMTDGETSFQPRPKNMQPGVYETKTSRDSTAALGGGGTSTTFEGKKWESGDVETQLMTLCANAKSRKITVFTIGFKITGGNANHFYQQLEKCASSPSHFYRVENTDIASAFKSIASTISPVRLVSGGGR